MVIREKSSDALFWYIKEQNPSFCSTTSYLFLDSTSSEDPVMKFTILALTLMLVATTINAGKMINGVEVLKILLCEKIIACPCILYVVNVMRMMMITLTKMVTATMMKITL